ncbi:MAG: SDR family oxidoreductase [Trebonia sp.]
MRVFVTGATGWIGSAVITELMEAGHDVTGLARSEQSAAKLQDREIEVVRGTLEELGTLKAAAASADGVIHTAYNHDDFDRFADAAALNQRVIEAFAEVLDGTGKPLVFSSGTGSGKPGQPATETDLSPRESHPRVVSEYTRVELAARGIRVSSVRHPPTVHGDGDHGFVAVLTQIARSSGVSAYIGDGANRWPAVHVLDAAPLYLKALTQAPAGAVLNSVAEEGIPTREIAEAIGRALGVPTQSIEPDQATDHFGFLAMFFALDLPASSELTRATYDWHPTHPGLLDDLNAGYYTREISTAGTPA